MKSYHLFILIFVTIIATKSCLAKVTSKLLKPRGRNVCSKEFSYNSYYYMSKSHTGYQNYRTCCKRFCGWCTSHCTRYKTIQSYHSESNLRVKKKTSYFCCLGWAVRDDKTGDECYQAICEPPCVTGRCDAPNKCNCTKGFSGKWCENEINECLNVPRPCDQDCTNLYGNYSCSCRRGYRKVVLDDQNDRRCRDINECVVAEKAIPKVKICQCVYGSKYSKCKATCVNTLGSYKCKCSAGYDLVANKVCTDTDECRTGHHKCTQTCWNTHGSYKCTCYPGFVLGSDGYSCNDLNECSYSNGACDQICTNNVGSYACSCRNGFTLVGTSKCEDVNECKISRPCDNFYGICMNRWGAYECACKHGYELQYDGKTCKDINECERINTCNQRCLNTDGSYYCSCSFGYKLEKDGKTCVDIDECKEGLSKCTHKCTNIDGSYKCQCPTGYFLGEDGYTCIGAPCRTLYKPHNGYYNCTGFFVNDRCYFGCNQGYENKGVSVKICLVKSRWSDGQPRCVPAMCDAARPPPNGVLTEPCVPEYKSRCFIKCQKGYHMHGLPIIDCKLYEGKTKWFVKTTCQEINLCTPNPCTHGGKCVVLSAKRFKCDCSNTGYRGNLCERGIVTVPEFPQMVKGEESDEFYIRAKPDRYFNIKLTTVVNNSVSFYPSDTLSLYAPREEIMFKLTPLRTGLIRIRYTLYGKDSFSFDQPEDGIIYIFPSENVKRLSNIPGEKFMKDACNKLAVDQCMDGSNIMLSSTCKWHASGTFGYVSVNSGNISLPLSMTGVNFAASEGVKQFSNTGVLTVSQLTQEMLTKGRRLCPTGSCPSTGYTNTDNDFFLKRNSFVRSYHNSVSDLNPWWITCTLPTDYEGFHVNDIQSLLLRAHKMKELTNGNCPNIPSDLEGTYSALVTRAPVNIDIMGQSTIFDSSFSTCIVLDLCSKFSYVSLPADKHLDAAPSISSLDVHIKGFGFSDDKFQKEICVPVWDAVSMQDNNFCVKAKLWSKVNIRFEALNTKLEFQGELFTEPKDIDNAMIERFNLVQKTYMKGSLCGKISIRVHGKKLNLISVDQKATVVTQLGGSQERCMPSSLKGVHLSMHASAVNIDYETSALRLYPKVGNTTIQSHIYYDLLEGHVLSIDGLPRVKLAMRRAEIPLKQIRMLKMMFKRLTSKYKLELTQLTMVSSTYSTKRKDAYRIIVKGTPNYKDLLISINKLKKEGTFLIDSLIAFKDAVFMTERSQSLIKRVKSLTGIIIRQLKQLSRITIKPKVAELLEIKEGLSISYFGQVCVHSLCFSNNIISIFDLKDDLSCTNNWNTKKLSENIYITAISKKIRKLGPYFIVHPGTKVKIQMSKTSNDFTIDFPATVAIFNKTFSTTVKINQEKFEFNLHDVLIENVTSFNVIATSEFRLTSTWDSIDFFYTGKGSNSSSLATTLEKMADEIITSVAKRTTKRIDDINKKLQKSKDLIRQYSKEVSSLKEDFVIKDRLRRIANATYIKAYVNLTREKARFHSQVRADLLRNLSRILDAICIKKECKKVCTTMTLHDICQEITTGFVHELKCDHIKTTTRSTVEEGSQSECAMQRKKFIPIYTGTCRKGGQDALKSSLTQTGAGIGAAVGMLWGPAGSAVGSVIGSAVGMFCSLFSSCDKSYEVFKQVINYQVPCVLKVFNTHTKTFTVTQCYTVNRLVVKEYGEPKPCAVGNSSCILTNDPKCTEENNNCRKQRATVSKQILETMNVTNQVWLNMELYELRLGILFPLMLQARNTATEAKRKYERKVAYLKRAELELKFAKSSIDNIDSFLLLEKCFVRIYNTSKQGEGFLKFHNIFFKTPTPDAENILLELFVNQPGSRQKFTEFLYVFEDQITSIKQGVLKILRNNLCMDIYRKRRSIVSDIVGNTQSLHMNYPFSEISNNKEVKESEIVCINSITIFTYMQKLAEKLRNATINALIQEDGIRSSQLNIERVIKNLKMKRMDPVVNEQLTLMKDARSRNTDELKELTINNVLLNWNQNMELFTESCNFTACFNTKDCVKAAIQTLYVLPSMIKVKRSVYTTQIHMIEGILNKIFTRPENLDVLKQLALELQNSIMVLKKMTSFCSRAPEVKLTSLPKVVAFAGEVVELSCLSKSDLPLSYNWKHNNKSLLFENQSKLRLFVQNSTRGSYVCESWNRAGRSSSEETFIVLQKKPLFLQQPQDFSFLSTVVTKIKPFYVCNVTADPLPKISWYYQPFNQPTRVLKLHSTKPILNIDKPNVANNGFYYCVASNQYGSTKSRKARLDVLVGELPRQQLSVAFNFPMSRIQAKGGKYEEKMKSDSKIEAKQSLGINMEDAGSEEVKVQVDIEDRSDTDANGLQDFDLLRKVSTSRRSLSEGIQRIVSGMVDAHGHNFVAEMERTMLVGFDGDRCSDGHSLHANGFTCAPCQAGFYEFAGRCLKCPIGTYQPYAGKTKCIVCEVTEVTAETGSLTRRECQTPVLHSMDVIIVLDTSTTLPSNEFSKVRQFVSNFVRDFIGKRKDLRFGLISFNDNVEYLVRLSNYGHSISSLMRKIDLIKQSGPDIRRSEKAVHLAAQALIQSSEISRRKVIISLISGTTTGEHGVTGFQVLRNESLNLHRLGIHSVAIGIGSHVDRNELLALASITKENNIIEFRNGGEILINDQKLPAVILKGECSFSGKDVAIAIESSSAVDDTTWSNTLYFVQNFMRAFVKDRLMKFGFLSYGSKILSYRFKRFKNVKDIETAVSTLPRVKDRLNAPNTLNFLYNSYITEKYQSFYDKKIIILISKKPVKDEELANVNKIFSFEDVKFLNVVMSLDKQVVGVSDIGLEESKKVIYSLAEATELISRVKVLKSNTENKCLY